MKRLARPDPLIVLVGGVIIVCGALGVFAMLKLTPDQVAQLEAGVIMIVSGIRMWLSRRTVVDPAAPTPVLPTRPGLGDGG
jgi:uncharacterized membrane protein YfcA